MTDEYKLKARVADGKNAELLINNLAPSITAIRADLFRSFTKSKFKDTAERDEIWRKMQSLDWVEQNIQRRIRDGENANKTLLQRIKDKFKNQGS